MFTYQKTGRYFAQIATGLEQYGAEELSTLGAQEVKPGFRGIYFNADQETLYRINYMSRLCSRIFAPLLSFDCHSTKYLYKTARKLQWPLLIPTGKTFAIAASVANSKISHSQYAALCLKDAIVDQFRDRDGSRPAIDKKKPDVWLNLRIENNRATISLDTSGGSLHRRGYRQMNVEAPMHETLAAAIIHLARWNGETPLIDPMCGSGTILSEALMHHCSIPAGYLRKKFGFEAMPEFDNTLWNQVKAGQNTKIKRLPKGLLMGSDVSTEAIEAAKTNNLLLPFGDKIIFKKKPYQDISFLESATIVTNPPYGIRLKQEGGISQFMRELSDFFKNRCRKSTVYLYLGKPALAEHIQLKPSWKKDLMNGGLKGQLIKYKF